MVRFATGRTFIVWIVMMTACLMFVAWADSPRSETKVGSVPLFNPTKTVVAVLPIVNQTGRRGEADDVCTAGCEFTSRKFSDRGFKIVAPDKVASCLAKRKIDLSDEESRGKTTLRAIGEELKADLVVCSGLQELDSDIKSGPFVARKVARARLQMKILDVSAQNYLVNGTFETKKKGGWLAPGLTISKGLRSGAMEGVVEKSLEDFLKPYKVIPKSPEAQGEKNG